MTVSRAELRNARVDKSERSSVAVGIYVTRVFCAVTGRRRRGIRLAVVVSIFVILIA